MAVMIVDMIMNWTIDEIIENRNYATSVAIPYQFCLLGYVKSAAYFIRSKSEA